MNEELYRLAKNNIDSDFGDISDLPKACRDTIANIYFKRELLILSPNTSILSKWDRDSVFYQWAIPTLPGVIDSIKDMLGPIRDGNSGLSGKNPEEHLTNIFLLVYKYRLDNVMKRPYLISAFLKLFVAHRVKEIPWLYESMQEMESQPKGGAKIIVECGICSKKLRAHLNKDGIATCPLCSHKFRIFSN